MSEGTSAATGDTGSPEHQAAVDKAVDLALTAAPDTDRAGLRAIIEKSGATDPGQLVVIAMQTATAMNSRAKVDRDPDSYSELELAELAATNPQKFAAIIDARHARIKARFGG